LGPHFCCHNRLGHLRQLYIQSSSS
jgi:hypothetical protein